MHFSAILSLFLLLALEALDPFPQSLDPNMPVVFQTPDSS